MIVWVTRDEPPDGPLATALRDRGLDAIVEPVITRQVVADPGALLADLRPTDWLILTSPFAIDAVKDVPAARVPNVAVVGESSRAAALAAGLRVELTGADGHGETLFAALRGRVQTGVVCYPRSARATSPESWGAIELRCPVLYDTQPRAFDRGVVERVALAAVASPSAVKALGELDVLLASIGRATSAAIRGMGREPVVEAAYPTFENLAVAIADYLNSSRHQRA
jgi:uroporphyrinogen-III synthase